MTYRLLIEPSRDNYTKTWGYESAIINESADEVWRSCWYLDEDAAIERARVRRDDFLEAEKDEERAEVERRAAVEERAEMKYRAELRRNVTV